MSFQSETKLVDELRESLEKQYTDQLEKAQNEWKKEEIKRINDKLTKQKEELVKVVKMFQLFGI